MRRFVAGLCSLAALALAASPAASADAVAGHLRVAIDSNPDFSDMPAAARDNVVVLQGWQTALLHRLKAQNPNVKVLLYKDASAASSGGSGTDICSGVSKATALANGWLLKDRAGLPFAFGSYSFLWAADIGARGYQDAWAGAVLAQLKSDAWDGVFMDDVNPTIRFHHDVSDVAKYPTDAAYSAATGSFLAEVGPRIKAAGKLAIPNIGSWSDYSSVVKGWLPSVSGGMDEMFTKWGAQAGDGYREEAGWDRQLQEVKDATAAGQTFLGVAHSATGDRAAARFGFATMLLGAAGPGHASFTEAGDYSHQNWIPEFGYDLGAPTGAEHADANHVHVRSFARGLVVVNPTAESHRIEFGGTYTGSGLGPSAGATLAPDAALILTRSGGATPAEPGGRASDSVLRVGGGLRRVHMARGHIVRLRLFCGRRHRSCHARLRLLAASPARGRMASVAKLAPVASRSVIIRRFHYRLVTFRLARSATAGQAIRVLGARRVRVSPRRRFVLAR